MLSGVNVAIGVTGSIAAVRTVELIHELRREGARVRAICSEDARSIIHPYALEFATEHAVVTEITGRVEHIDLCGTDGWADVLLLAPATANTIGKMAGSIDDTPVTTVATTAIGAGVPVVVAPAMHAPMADHPGIETALSTLESWGVDIVGPVYEEGKAKLATDEAILTGVARAIDPGSLAGKHIVVTSGATAEQIDPVRILTNRASGRMGRAIAKACFIAGADVTLVHPEGAVPYASTKTVESNTAMTEATLEALENADALISAAAIGDFTIDAFEDKLDSSEAMTLDLQPAPKLLDDAREAFPELPIVGFKLETGDRKTLIEAARASLDDRNLAFVVANGVESMGGNETAAIIVDAETETDVSGSKQALAGEIVERLTAELS